MGIKNKVRMVNKATADREADSLRRLAHKDAGRIATLETEIAAERVEVERVKKELRNGDAVITRLSEALTAATERVDQLEKERDLERAVSRAMVSMTVARLAGKVEGHPTHSGNFLQRIDALRAAESELATAEATIRSIAVMLGWGNVPPRDTLERNLSANRIRLEAAESALTEARETAAARLQMWQEQVTHISALQSDLNVSREEGWRLREALAGLASGPSEYAVDPGPCWCRARPWQARVSPTGQDQKHEVGCLAARAALAAKENAHE